MKTLKYTLFICILFISQMASAQISRISGTVSDDIDVLPGATIKEVDSSNRTINATVTDGNGNFAMPIKSAKNKLVVSYVGYQTQTLVINKAVFKIKLSDNVVTKKELNVVAKKMVKTSGLAIPEHEISFSTQGITAKDFEGLGITSVDEALQGRIAGLDIVANSGDLGAGTQMRLRGTTTISEHTTNEPLIVVNNEILTDVSSNDIANLGLAEGTANEEKFAELLKVNPEDIAEIRVLKDAAATAIWGVRGANGVIEITTKRGSKGPASVTYTGRFTATHQPEAIPLLNGDQYTMMLKEAYFNPKLSDTDGDIPELNYDYDGFSEAYMYDNNTDWLSLVKQNGFNQSHTVTVSGGDDKTHFRISGGYDHQTGTVIKQVMNRFTTRMALDYFVSDRIKVTSDLSVSYTDNHRNADGLIDLGYRKMPNLSPYYEYTNDVWSDDYYYMLRTAGSPVNKPSNSDSRLSDQKGMANPLASAALAKNQSRNFDLGTNLALEYQLLGLDNNKSRLTYRGSVNINSSSSYGNNDYPRQLMMSTNDFLNAHTSSSNSSKSLSFSTRHNLTFNPVFKNRDHYATMQASFQLSSGSNSSQNTSGKRLPEGITDPSAGGLVGGMGSSWGEHRSMAYYYTVHYSYKGRYILGGTLRMDGTTKMGPNKRWFFVPAISSRWNIGDEKWMQPIRKAIRMSELGVSLNYGIQGNQPSGDYMYLNKYSKGDTYLGTTSMVSSSLKMSNFNAERVYQGDMRINVGFMDQKLTFGIDLYNRQTVGMLTTGYISSATGWNNIPFKNEGNMRNRGWEVSMNANNVVKKGKFGMDLYLNFANNNNLITKMSELTLEHMNNDDEIEYMTNGKTLQRVQVNNPFGAIYGFRCKGTYQYNYTTAEKWARDDRKNGTTKLQDMIDEGHTIPIALAEATPEHPYGKVIYNEKSEPIQMLYYYKQKDASYISRFNGGDAMYEDTNNDGQIDNLDLVYLGSSLPKLNGGFGITFRYGHWRLSSQFNYRVDIDVFNQARMNMENMNGTTNQSQAVNYRWRKEGDGGFGSYIPRALSNTLHTNYNTLISDRFIEDASFVRLNYLSLNYSFDSKLIKKWHLRTLNFYLNANNLFCLTHYSGVEPEIGAGGRGVATDGSKTPRAKSYTFGINIGF